MTLSGRDRKLALGAAASVAVLLILRFGVLSDPAPAPVPAANSGNIEMTRQRVVRLRKIAALVPSREALMKQAAADLADREHGILQADTAPQAQALLLEIARRVGKAEQIDVRGGDFGAPKIFGDYGLVYATVTFDCHVEQLVNFLADLTRQQELVVPSEERITSGNPKDKIMGVRMVLAGVVPKKLVPEKKGLGAF